MIDPVGAREASNRYLPFRRPFSRPSLIILKAYPPVTAFLSRGVPVLESSTHVHRLPP